MDATIINLGSTSPDDDVFLSGPRVHLPAGETMTWANVTLADLDAEVQLTTLILAGSVSVSLAYTTSDRAVSLQGSVSPHKLPRYTVAALPAGADAIEGMVAYATNGRKTGEGGGAGTGVPVYYGGAAWLTYPADAAVTS